MPSLNQTWTAQLARSASVKDVVKSLPDLVVELEHSQESAVAHAETQEAIRRLGVQMIHPLEGAQPGRINLRAQGWVGWSNLTVAQYVEKVLAVAADVPHKLNRHPAALKHAFIWTTIGTDPGIQSMLENRDETLPLDAPSLPEGVTHVWVAGSFVGQGVVAWFPERGWWRPDWSWPEGQPLELIEDDNGDALPDKPLPSD